MRAIENFRKAVGENVDVKNRPELAPLRKTLLREPQDFYRELRGDIEASGEARPEARARSQRRSSAWPRSPSDSTRSRTRSGRIREAIDV